MNWFFDLFRKQAEEPSVQVQPAAEPTLPLPEFDLAEAPSQGFAQPHFRFFPTCYEFRVGDGPLFERTDGPCHICGMKDILRYVGGYYGPKREGANICAQCLYDGRIGELFSADGSVDSYSLHDAHVEGLNYDDPIVDEVMRRTPRFSTFNPFEWPSLESTPMAFVGYGEDEAWGRLPNARAAVSHAWNEAGVEDVYPSPYLLIFRDLDGENYRAVLDFD